MTPRFVREVDRWYHLGYNKPAVCRLRVWLLADDTAVAIVTERDDNPGLSVTNAAETIYERLSAEYPQLRLIEHYLPLGHRGDTYSEVTVRGGRAMWTALDRGRLAALLPGVEL